MSINNDVNQVLVTKDNQELVASGGTLDSILPGQLGVFDADTNLAINATNNSRNIYLAVGVNRAGGAVSDDINKSAGQLIQLSKLRFLNFRPHTPGAAMVIEIAGYTGASDTDYAIRLEFRNQEIYRRIGYNQFTHTYSIKLPCQECVSCGEVDANLITSLMVEAMNADDKGLIVAEAIAKEAITAATHGTSVDYAIGDVISEADLAAISVFNAAQPDSSTHLATGIRVTTNPTAVNSYCAINLKYYWPRQTNVLASLVEGFDCSGTVTVVNETVFEEGSGYDLKELEYKAGGWNGKSGPYRKSSVYGLASNDIEYFADAAVKYDKFALTYDQESVAGWADNRNHLATIVGIPAVDTVTRDAFALVLDSVMPGGFDPIADDAALADVDPTVEEPINALTPETDGDA